MKTLDIDECAAFLKVNRSTAFELAQSGELPGAKIGRAWVFLEDDLVEYLRAKVRQQQEQRQAKASAPTVVKQEPKPIKTEAISAFPAIRRQSRGGRRTPLPVLPELVGQIAPA